MHLVRYTRSGANSLLAQVLVREAQLSQDDERHVPDGRVPRHYRHRDRPSVRRGARPHEHLGTIREKTDAAYWQRAGPPDPTRQIICHKQRHTQQTRQLLIALIVRTNVNELRADAGSEAAAPPQAHATFRTIVPTTRAGRCFCQPKCCIPSTYIKCYCETEFFHLVAQEYDNPAFFFFGAVSLPPPVDPARLSRRTPRGPAGALDGSYCAGRLYPGVDKTRHRGTFRRSPEIGRRDPDQRCTRDDRQTEPRFANIGGKQYR